MKKRVVIILAMLIACTMILSGCNMVKYDPKEITYDNVVSEIDKLKIDFFTVTPVEGDIPAKTVQADNSNAVVMYELPDIDSYDPVVVGKARNNIEIFLPLEDNNSSINKVVEEVARRFNKEHEGDCSVTIRMLEPTLANDFIKSRSYLPEGYIASNELYGLMLKESGIEVRKITDRLMGNTIGVVIKADSAKKIKLSESENKFDTVFKAVMNDEIKIGYPNPTNNPSGLNFVISMLSYFDSTNPFSMEATTDFSSFQSKVSVAYSTAQLKEAVSRGQTDGFVMEYEAYKNDDTLKGYEFIPFGVRHDYPLYSVDSLSEAESDVLCEFARFFENPEIVNSITAIGFNQNDDYVSKVNANSYEGLIGEVLEYFKTEKRSGKKVAVYFVCDVSGSMAGRKLEALKNSALDAMQYIAEDNLVGLITYNGSVKLNLPLGEFDTTQQRKFAGTIRSLSSGGGTATNNALLMTLKLLDAYHKENSDTIPMIFLLSDGYTESGYSLNDVKCLIEAFDIPIYTIGYEANLKELQSIASINNGVSFNASTDDIGYILKSLFDAQT